MSVTRVHYRERQRLRAADLRAEQAYRRALAARHGLTAHDWGVVRGLRVARAHAGAFSILPGVAIDGYGRELVVAEPMPLEIEDTERCWSVVLHGCERPEQRPPGRSCEEVPAPRIAAHVIVSLIDGFEMPDDDGDPVDRVVQSSSSEGQPWPVLLARIGRACAGSASAPIVDYSRTRYVRHRAALIRGPHGRAQLQLGLQSRTDVYQFLLSTSNAATVLEHRAGIDRAGEIHVWRPLVISGARASGSIALTANRLLTVETALPGGIGRRLRIDGELDVRRGTIAAQLFDLGGAARAPAGVLQGRDTFVLDEPLSLRFRFDGDHFANIALLDPVAGEPVPLFDPARDPRPSRRRRKTAKPAQAVSQDVHSFSLELKPGGAALALRERDDQGETIAVGCDDVSRVRASVRQLGTPVVQFRPAAEIEADPNTREIHAAVTSPATAIVPHVALRVSGGEMDDSDKSGRLAAGGRRNGDWVPALQIDGSRGVAILDSSASADPANLLQVSGTVYLPPIGKKDPLLTELMALAFMTGLRQRQNLPGVSVAVTLGALNPPATIVRGQTLDYEMTFTFSGSLTVQRVVEVVIGTSGTGDMTLRTIPGIEPTTTDKDFDVEIVNFTHSASVVALQVHVLARKGSQTGVIVSEPVAIAVANPQ